MHELIQKEFREKAIYLYQIATILRMTIYYVQILKQLDKEPYKWFDKDICEIINKYYEKYINKDVVMKTKDLYNEFEDINFISIILTGVWTLSINAIQYVKDYENTIINISERIPSNIVLNIYFQKITEDTVICHTEFSNKKLLARSKYWDNIRWVLYS